MSDYAYANPAYKRFVIPAKAGIQTLTGAGRHPAVGEFGQPKTPWIPAFAGMTG
ncbi:MAG: hypothetical protein L0H37_11030 [Nitrosospira sp.]|nr:hypothetical protein [Nitrosospira sp.]